MEEVAEYRSCFADCPKGSSIGLNLRFLGTPGELGEAMMLSNEQSAYLFSWRGVMRLGSQWSYCPSLKIKVKNPIVFKNNRWSIGFKKGKKGQATDSRVLIIRPCPFDTMFIRVQSFSRLMERPPPINARKNFYEQSIQPTMLNYYCYT